MEGLKSNPFAASARIEPQRPGEYKGQRKHDLRIGRQPAYVDASRSELNRVLVKPPTTGEMQKICVARRAVRETKRAMKTGTTCAYIGIPLDHLNSAISHIAGGINSTLSSLPARVTRDIYQRRRVDDLVFAVRDRIGKAVGALAGSIE